MHGSPQSAARDLERVGLADRGLVQVFAVQIEYLDPPVLAVGDVECLAVDDDRMRKMELPRADSGPSPLADLLSVRSVFKDPGIAVAVGHKDAAIGPEGDVRGPVEAVLGPGGLA